MKSTIITIIFIALNLSALSQDKTTYPNSIVIQDKTINSNTSILLIIDTLSLDTMLFFTYKNSILNGPFIAKVGGFNLKLNFISTQLNNFTDISKNIFEVKGNFKNGELSGQLNQFFANRNLFSTMEFNNGKLNKEQIEYYDNGKPKSIKTYRNGLYHGSFKYFNESDNKTEESLYKKNELIKSIFYEWFENQKLKNVASYKYDNTLKIGHGIFLNYYENGKKQSESTYKNGKPKGIWKQYYENGSLKNEILYKHFTLKYHIEYDKNGQVIKKSNYNNSKK